MTSIPLTNYLLGSLLISLLLAAYLFFLTKSAFSELEMQLLATKLRLEASLKEQIRGGIEFRLRELSGKNTTSSLEEKTR
jgi:hypothetical protein